MEHDRFVELTNEVFDDVGMLLNSKNKEYARGGDKLHNFKKASRFLKSRSQVEALRGMLLKHTVSIYDMMDDYIDGKPRKPLSMWKEKVFDHIAYLVILLAMIEEEQDCQVTSSYGIVRLFENLAPSDSEI